MSKSKLSVQSHSFILTAWFPDGALKNDSKTWARVKAALLRVNYAKVKNFAFTVERTKTSEKFHLQIYFQTLRSTTGRWVKTWMNWPWGCHVAPKTWGLEAWMESYCKKKDETYISGPFQVIQDSELTIDLEDKDF